MSAITKAAKPFCMICGGLAFGLLVIRSSLAATEMEERAAISKRAQTSFLANDFAQLEILSNAYRKEKSRTSSGTWELTFFYNTLSEIIDKQAEGSDVDSRFQMLENRTKQWAQQYPDSPSAHIVHAMVLAGHGWAYRGDELAPLVKPESWEPFRRYVAMARKYLEQHKSVAAVDPRWYGEMMTIARAQGWERNDFDHLLEEALDREPLYYQTYFDALQYLMPKWHGSLEEMEAFAQAAARRTAKQEGQSLYARIYWSASQSHFGSTIFTATLAEWPQVKAGFEDILSRYPDSWNLNNFAKFACLAQDKAKARELLKRTENSIMPEAWTPLGLRVRCATWAARD